MKPQALVIVFIMTLTSGKLKGVKMFEKCPVIEMLAITKQQNRESKF